MPLYAIVKTPAPSSNPVTNTFLGFFSSCKSLFDLVTGAMIRYHSFNDEITFDVDLERAQFALQQRALISPAVEPDADAIFELDFVEGRIMGITKMYTIDDINTSYQQSDKDPNRFDKQRITQWKTTDLSCEVVSAGILRLLNTQYQQHFDLLVINEDDDHVTPGERQPLLLHTSPISM